MEVSTLSRKKIILECHRLISEKGCKSVVTLNSLMLRQAWANPQLLDAINRASLITADSIGISLASFLLNGRMPRRYPGIELMQRLIRQGWRVFLLGGSDGVAVKAACIIKKKWPHINICGTHHGYFSRGKEEKVLTMINNLKPDILFVGLDLPKQEIWVDEIRGKVNAGMIIGVGGSFDVLSGDLVRAPYIVRKFGVEWLWRMGLQPWRIKRIIKLPLFFLEVMIRFFRQKRLLQV